MKLMDIMDKKGAKIYELEPDGDPDGIVIFDHPDGMYSYCYIEGQPDKLIHLNLGMPLEPYKDGYRVPQEERIDETTTT